MAPPTPSDPIMRRQHADLEEKQEPRRNTANVGDDVKKELAPCNPNREKFPCSASASINFVQRQIRNSTPKTYILRFLFLQPFDLITLQATWLPPSIVPVNSDRLPDTVS